MSVSSWIWTKPKMVIKKGFKMEQSTRITRKKVLEKIPFLKKNGTPSLKLLRITREILYKVEPKKKFYWGAIDSHYGMYYMETIVGFKEVFESIFMSHVKTENDAPRGGQIGNHIILSKKDYNLLLKRLAYVVDFDEL